MWLSTASAGDIWLAHPSAWRRRSALLPFAHKAQHKTPTLILDLWQIAVEAFIPEHTENMSERKTTMMLTCDSKLGQIMTDYYKYKDLQPMRLEVRKKWEDKVKEERVEWQKRMVKRERQQAGEEDQM